MNTIQEHHLKALDQDSILELCDKAKLVWQEGFTPEVKAEVWAQCGGHPFIVQGLLHYLCKEPNPPQTTRDDVIRLSTNFMNSRMSDFEGWAEAIGIEGLLAYGVLVTHSDWMTESELLKRANHPQLNIKRGLNALCYHCLAIHDDGWVHCRYTGSMFSKWFMQCGEAFIRQEIRKDPHFSDAESAHEFVLRVTGPLFEAKIDTAGGAYIEGDVNTDGGDFTGRDSLSEN